MASVPEWKRQTAVRFWLEEDPEDVSLSPSPTVKNKITHTKHIIVLESPEYYIFGGFLFF